MSILSDADKNRHRIALQLRGESRATHIGLAREDQVELWEIIESTLVPRLVMRLIQQARITYASGRYADATCYLRVDPSLVPDGVSLLTMAKLQLMLDRMLDFHAVRDNDIKVDMRDASRLRKLFDDEIELFDSSYCVAVEPTWFDFNDVLPGKMRALHLETLVILEPISDKFNPGPRIYRNQARWRQELERN